MFKSPWKRAALFILLIAVAIMLATLARLGPASEAEEWPHAALDSAIEISLSTAHDLVHDGSLVARGGILGNYLYLEGVEGADLTPYLPDPEEDDSRPDAEPRASIDDDAALPLTLKSRIPFPAYGYISELAETAPVDIRIYQNPGYEATFSDRLFQLLPVLFILLIVALILMRGGARTLGLTPGYTVIEKDKLSESFDDVAGIDLAQEEIQEVVDFLRNPEAAARLGGRMPKGVLFSGPPGTGKTLLARAMAREAGVPFLALEASGINQIFVGAGAMKIRKAFREARKRAPCIVFIDEIDALGRARGSVGSGAGDEKENTLNALLVELDGFDARDGVVVIAATNRKEILDPALTRRGRFDRNIHFTPPDLKGRTRILKVHCRKIKTSPDLDVKAVARTVFGFSGADLAALVNEAALIATRKGADHVDLDSFMAARDRLLIGLSGTRPALGDRERRITAVHEAGHALVAACTPDTDPIEKATILPQGGAIGYVLQSPDADRVFETRDRLVSRIRVAVAGRAAEHVILGAGAITSGAASDIEMATQVARNMVARFGMSAQGFIKLDPNDILLHDPKTPALEAIREIIQGELDRVTSWLEKNRGVLESIATELEKHETLNGAEIQAILAAHSPTPID